jgi:hypothetical protein
MLAAESQQVIMLRTLKLAAGGEKAKAEARRMVSEKVVSAGVEGTRLALGATPQSVISRYRNKVKANLRRLTKIT